MIKRQRLNLLKHIRPVHLLTTLALYLLGTGFARYLGQRIDYSLFLLGLVWLLFLQLGYYFLGDHFKTPFDAGLYKRLPFNSGEKLAESSQSGEMLLYLSVSCFTGVVVLSVLLILQGAVSISTAFLMGLFFAGNFLLVVPGVSLNLSGVGEIITSIVLVIIPPAFSFFLQYGTFHRFIALGIFPLFPLHLALILLLRLTGYSDDLRNNRKNLLVRIGWIQGIFLHNLMIFSGFLLFGVALLFGFPVRIVGSIFLTLPAALYLVWYLSQLEDGAPVRWPLFTLLSLVVFFLPVYLLTYSSWVR
jgi:1,4-dihydroxy-2-naphthoate octaprenyltransferase